MKEIPLSQGKVALVDDEDYGPLTVFKWRAYRCRNTFYTQRTVTRPDGGETTERMHRVVLARKLGRVLVKGEECEHENGNGLDNRSDNLRSATKSQNHRNRHHRKDNLSSQYLGVYRDNRYKRWCAQIQVPGKHVHLGSYATELEAAIARELYIAAHPELMARSNFAEAAKALP